MTILEQIILRRLQAELRGQSAYKALKNEQKTQSTLKHVGAVSTANGSTTVIDDGGQTFSPNIIQGKSDINLLDPKNAFIPSVDRSTTVSSDPRNQQTSSKTKTETASKTTSSTKKSKTVNKENLVFPELQNMANIQIEDVYQLSDSELDKKIAETTEQLFRHLLDPKTKTVIPGKKPRFDTP
jgi:ribosomal protein L29